MDAKNSVHIFNCQKFKTQTPSHNNTQKTAKTSKIRQILDFFDIMSILAPKCLSYCTNISVLLGSHHFSCIFCNTLTMCNREETACGGCYFNVDSC